MIYLLIPLITNNDIEHWEVYKHESKDAAKIYKIIPLVKRNPKQMLSMIIIKLMKIRIKSDFGDWCYWSGQNYCYQWMMFSDHTVILFTSD